MMMCGEGDLFPRTALGGGGVVYSSQITNLSVLFSALLIIYVHSKFGHFSADVRLGYTLDFDESCASYMPLSVKDCPRNPRSSVARFGFLAA